MVKKTLYIIATIVTLIVFAGFFYSTSIRGIRPSETIPEVDKTRHAKVLTAFYGMDALPFQSLLLYPLAIGKNGMPVVFSQEVDPATLDNTDFEVVTGNGQKHTVEFVTLKPSNEEFELRTALLIGEYGTYSYNPKRSN